MSYVMDQKDLRLFKNILTNNNIASNFILHYNEEIFSNPVSQKFADFIVKYYQTYKTTPTKRIALETFNPKDAQTIESIYNLLDSVEINASEFKYDLDQIKNDAIINYTLDIKNKLNNTDLSNVNNVSNILQTVNKISKKIATIEQPEKKPYTNISLNNYLPEFKLNYNNKYKDPDLKQGYLTQYKYLDFITNGFGKNDLIIIGAETGGGKSLLLANLANNMWMGKNNIFSKTFSKGLNILYFSLEMSYDQCFNRALASLADVSSYGIRDANLNKTEMLAIKQVTEFIEKFPYHYQVVDVPRGETVEGIEEKFKECCETFRPDIVFVDYLGLLDSSEKISEDWLKLGVIAGKLHEFARANNVCVVTAAQLNRKSKNSSESDIGIHRFGRSSLMLHHATLGMIIESRPDEHTYGDMAIHIVKNRNGALGSFTLDKKLANSKLSDPDIVILPDISSKTYSPTDAADISKLLSDLKWDTL